MLTAILQPILAVFAAIGIIMPQAVATALWGALALILVDFILGIFLSLKQGTFDFNKLPQFLKTNIIPYVGSLVLLAFFTGTVPSLQALFLTCAAAVAASFLKDVIVKLGQVFTGIQFQSPIITTVTTPKNDTTTATLNENQTSPPAA